MLVALTAGPEKLLRRAFICNRDYRLRPPRRAPPRPRFIFPRAGFAPGRSLLGTGDAADEATSSSAASPSPSSPFSAPLSWSSVVDALLPRLPAGGWASSCRRDLRVFAALRAPRLGLVPREDAGEDRGSAVDC